MYRYRPEAIDKFGRISFLGKTCKFGTWITTNDDQHHLFEYDTDHIFDHNLITYPELIQVFKDNDLLKYIPTTDLIKLAAENL